MLQWLPSLALVRAELRAASRRTRSFVLRCLLPAALLFLLVAIYQPHWEYGSRLATPLAISGYSATFFTAFGVAQLAAIALFVPGLTATCITQLQDRRTLDDWLVTPLTNAEIVLGLLVGRLVQIAAVVASSWTVLALAALLGGSDLASLARLTALSAGCALLVAGLSLAVSVNASRSREAVQRVYGALILLWAVPPAITSTPLNWLITWSALPLGVLKVINVVLIGALALNPFAVFVGTERFGISEVVAPITVASHSLLGLLGIGWAVMGIRRKVARRAGRGRAHPNWWARPLRRPAIGNYPVLWKECSRATNGSRALAVMFATAVLGFVGWWAVRMWSESPDWRDQILATLFGLGVLLACSTLVLVACRGAVAVTIERERDTWLSLMATPLTAREIMFAKLAGAIYKMRWLIGLIGVLGCLAVLVDPRTLLPALGTAAVLGVLLVAAAALGLSVSRGSTTSGRALLVTLAIGFFVGGGYMLLCIPFQPATVSVLAGVLPFLLVFPGVSYTEGNPPPEAITAFALGVAGYGVAAFVIILRSMREIDRVDAEMQSGEPPLRLPERSPATGVSPELQPASSTSHSA